MIRTSIYPDKRYEDNGWVCEHCGNVLKDRKAVVPDGDYQCKLTSIYFEDDRADYQIEITKGEHQGVVLKGKIYGRK